MTDKQTITDSRVSNTRVSSTHRLIRPLDLLHEMPVSDVIYEHVLEVRETIHRIVNGSDNRPLVIVGPCSIHDPVAAMDYARRLKPLAASVSDRLYVVMRVYFEKPRTTVGWKGLINDPAMNGSFDMGKGLRLARQLLLDINSLGLPTATEILEPFTPQYIGDLLGWVAIGARTTESQTHRQMASGLSAPVGFKNSTDGNTKVAVDAMLAAASSHTFLGINELGETSIVETTGNSDTHLILRGGSRGTNYDQQEVFKAAEMLRSKNLNPRLMVDCSHANSGKNYSRQVMVWDNLIDQIRQARSSNEPSFILGAMLESHINAGRQDIDGDLAYGVSITDACIDWQTTEELLQRGYRQLG
ncbi:MAG: 3-deoxy-7-phosphoheptulonate synthase [gamma proteobacterium symbiont of Ctena orbiculata]|uniref:Phospho-2-dehydro-3-deoxyheptonate aldolase n=1 Tax=Candidatus Thiodiazotropha taylori TaxID=2792791 RepID=A0A944M8Z0_9GAMM|nr:3-deoxy-7-phosphoheptulonate synthase [Candidatus Thiodiazotropha taylori]PUB88151.1 MAG: 3-deoxy-7-phosphoheptulonate synthase [gamma proteobacterium symbiont of Ctena orbiculata]MBT3027015.1 3-deoxy-7-phosphoheptulonate synthase [Candidatus Thiodiazotropha taylori]MBT3034649.1 3-deoxy-7-phosphoheptulonate synthase [Candidatus Thiodiazotropha taylori]MBV2137436.1 3-deoxy-7-phosphoheptulonate synthase [Candidatus Thiodiazotropha taylori]